MSGETPSWVTPGLVALFGIIISALASKSAERLGDIKTALQNFDQRLNEHRLNAAVHEAGFATVHAEIKSLFEITKRFHERQDRHEEAHTP